MEKIAMGKGEIVLRGYDTEADAKKAKRDIERVLYILSGMSLYEVMKELAPYRVVAAKCCQDEYDELTEKSGGKKHGNV